MRISLKSLFLFIIFAGSVSSLLAQAAKEVFSTAVDHVNCETIRFIHREAGRAEVANNMDCLSFESIYKSIPTDEAGTTGALCKNINDYKNKFKEDKPLDVQLNAVIAFANAKIAAKKRKGNVEDFKASLEKIKKDALDAAKGTASASSTTTETKPGEETKTIEKTAKTSDTSQAISEPSATENSTKAGHKTDWLGLLGLLVGLGALGLAYMAYTKAKKIDGGSMHPMSTTYGNKSTKDDSMQEIQRVEKHLKGEITNLNRLIEELMKTATSGNNPTPRASPEPVQDEAPIGYRESSIEIERRAEEPKEERETESKIEVQKEPEMELVARPEEIIHEPEPALIAKPEESVLESETESERGIEKSSNDEVSPLSAGERAGGEAKTPFTGTLFESTPPTAPSPDLFATSAPAPKRPEPEREYNSITDAVAAGGYVQEPAAASVEPFMPEKEYEDGEAVPFYKFAGLPNEEGYFENNSFTDEPGQDSIYEIEMYEDVPDKAFFSIRSNPDVIRKAILDPQVYLAPCCSYTDDHEGKHTIVLVEEGMLRKEDNRWVVYEKAKINFE